jgi:hypothetical protein
MSLGFPGIGGSGQSGSSSSTSIGGGPAITSFRFGTSGAMTGGTVTVADTATTATSRYVFSTHALGTITAPAAYMTTTRTAGTSFVITSSQATDTSTVDYIAIN